MWSQCQVFEIKEFSRFIALQMLTYLIDIWNSEDLNRHSSTLLAPICSGEMGMVQPQLTIQLHLLLGKKVSFKNVPEKDNEKRRKKKEAAVIEQVKKHPLQFRWALWFFKNVKNQPWQCNLRLVTTFSTVEDFWALYTHIQLASKLSSGCDYSIFKDGIEPMWEDSRNKRGGRWLITLSKQQRHTDLDSLWLDTLLCLIGEAFEEYSDEVCGAVINIRAKGDKIAVWTRETENREAVTYIGRVYKERLGLSPKVVIGYQAHADTATKSSSLAKNKFVI
ncbi:eukaryotic translation initiation factor 4E type 1B [Gastrophryne carolinensis]